MREHGVGANLCSRRIEQKLRLTVLMLHRVVVPNCHGTIRIPVTRAAIVEKSIVAGIDQNQRRRDRRNGDREKPLQSMP